MGSKLEGLHGQRWHAWFRVDAERFSWEIFRETGSGVGKTRFQ